MEELSHISAFNHYFLTMVILITMVLISRTIVAGTKYSSILVIVIFGLTMGALLVKSGMAAPGLSEFPAIVLVSQTTIIALIATFFVGGQEIKGLMQFSLGWQVVAVFGSFTMLNAAGMELDHVSLAVASALSHFGLFAAVQGGMFGDAAAGLIAFIFAMPFLVHPLVFGMFGKAAEKDGSMAANSVLGFAVIGMAGIAYSLVTV